MKTELSQKSICLCSSQVLEDASLGQHVEDPLAGLFVVNSVGTATKCQHRNVKRMFLQKHHWGETPPRSMVDPVRPASWQLLVIFRHTSAYKAWAWVGWKPHLMQGVAWCLCSVISSRYSDHYNPHTASSDHSLLKQIKFEHCPSSMVEQHYILFYIPANWLLYFHFS